MASPSKGASALGDGGAFSAIFFDEADEHVASIEAILLGMDADAPDAGGLNAIFRAAHSIKGSSAMLGYTEIAALTHLLENLLDLLRKDERAIDKADIDAMLAAGDVVKLQVAHRRGLLDDTPDRSGAEALLRDCVAAGGGGGVAAAGGKPQRRHFSVRLGPLSAPIDAGELEMMLTGLAEMGAVTNQSADNCAGGIVRFDVALEGAEMDLRSVLSLVVAPGETHVAKLAPPPAAAPFAVAADATPGSAAHADDEMFVDPAEFKRLARQRKSEVAAAGAIDQFVAPEELKKKPALPVSPSASTTPPAASDDAPGAVGRRVTDAMQAPVGRIGRRGADRLPGAVYGDATSIRVATEKIDLLVNLVGELVITEAMLARQSGEQNGASATQSEHTGLADLARHTRNLQEAILAIRMVPISTVFSRFPRLVRELSDQMGKRVDIKTSGEATELDRGLIEKISDPLTHLVRNAIDHGLETPAVRLAAGKPGVGTITLSASQRGGSIVIEMTDDGQGLDRARILARAAERGSAIAPDAPDEEVWQLIFEAGFSTAAEVTEVSGRGVGMDVVRRNIKSLGGSIELVSRPGQGTRITVHVPLTLAIMEAMTVSIGGEIYVLPLAAVIESRRLDANAVHTLPGRTETLRVRDDFLPVLRLAEVFPPAQAALHGGGIAVIVEGESGNAAIVVDELVGQQQVVVKTLETNFRRVPGLSGATIMGDGRVALILDVSHLIHAAGRGR